MSLQTSQQNTASMMYRPQRRHSGAPYQVEMFSRHLNHRKHSVQIHVCETGGASGRTRFRSAADRTFPRG